MHVVDDPSVDAHTCPGGHVFVHAGVLDIGARDDSALAFILAHEMGHALCRHGAEKATLQLLSSAADAASWAAAVLAGADHRRRLHRRRAGGRRERRHAGRHPAQLARHGARGGPRGRAAHGARVLRPERRGPRVPENRSGAAFAKRDPADRRRSRRPGAPGAPVAGDGVSRLEAYLSTHPLDFERARNASAHARAVSFRDPSRRACASFRRRARAVRRFKTRGFLETPPPRTAAPSRRRLTRGARFIRNVDAKIAGSPRGVTGALGVAAGRAARAGSAPRRGRWAPARWAGSTAAGGLLAGGERRKTRETGRIAVQDRRSVQERYLADGILQSRVARARAPRARGRRARGTPSRKKGGEGGGAAERRGGADEGSGDAEAGETVLAGDGSLVDRGARRAVRGVASRTTRQWWSRPTRRDPRARRRSSIF